MGRFAHRTSFHETAAVGGTFTDGIENGTISESTPCVYPSPVLLSAPCRRLAVASGG